MFVTKSLHETGSRHASCAPKFASDVLPTNPIPAAATAELACAIKKVRACEWFQRFLESSAPIWFRSSRLFWLNRLRFASPVIILRPTLRSLVSRG